MKKYYAFALLFIINHFATATGDNFHLGARQAAMGNAAVIFSDVWSNHHNQAGLAFVKDISFGLTGESRFLIPQNSVKAAAFAYPTKSGTFGLNFTSYGYSAYRENKLGLAFAKSFGDNFAAGVQMDYISIAIGENYGNRNLFTVEAGIIAKPHKNLTLGAHLYNPNRAKIADYNDERIPTILRIGAGYKFSNKVESSFELQKDIDHRVIAKLGIEYHISDPLYLRTGIASNPFESTFGFGLNISNFKIDFSTGYHAVLGYTPQFSLTYNIERKGLSDF